MTARAIGSALRLLMVFVALVGLALAWVLCWTSRRDFGRQVEPTLAAGWTRR